MLPLCLTALLAPAASSMLGQQEPMFADCHVVKITPGQYGPRGANGDIVELKDGTLLYCHTSLDGKGIVANRSADKGRTWGEEFVLVPNPGPPSERGYYCHPSFIRCPNGDLLLSYIYANESLPYYGHNYYRRSKDEGQTWSEQFILNPWPGYCIIHNDRFKVLQSGRIIGVAEYKKQWPDSNDHSGYVAMTFMSDDNGYSWHPSKNDVDMLPIEAQEADVVELKDGRLMMMIRNYSGFVGRAFSEDQGETWSKGEMVEALPLSPNAGMPTVDRIPTTGDLVLIRPTGTGRDGKTRAPLTSVISKDEGQTWENPRDIGPDPNNDYGYQSLTWVDNVALVSYHALDGLHVARIRPEWFYGQ
jgi:sialidase-1